MAIIAVWSVKGGVGKTTLAANLAWVSASVTKRNTLLWDLDATGGAAFLLGVQPIPHHSARSAFAPDVKVGTLIQPTAYPRLSVLPADETIRSVELQLEELEKNERLATVAEKFEREFQRIVLDCPPVLNELSAQIVRAADILIVPLPPSPLSTRAFELVVQEVKRTVKRHPPILPVLSMLDMCRTLHPQAREANSGWPAVPLASALEQSAVRREPVGAFAPSSSAAKAIDGFWAAVERRLAKP